MIPSLKKFWSSLTSTFSSSFSLKSSSALSLASTLILLSSCQQIDDFGQETKQYTIESRISIDDVWQNMPTEQSKGFILSRAASDALNYYVYIFDSSDQAMVCGSKSMDANSMVATFPGKITSPGTYTLYGITNLTSAEHISTSTTPKPTSASTFTLATDVSPHDVCLGKKELTVTASQLTYSTTITVSHIMSQLALTVKSVPANVTSMSITLPKQANVFDFTGTFTGNTTSQTITLTQASAANSDGTYDWTSAATIVFPSATGTTSMPINITWSSATATDQVISTSSSYCCTSGKNLSLSTTWNDSFSASATLTTNDWSAAEEGTFDW